MGTRPSRNLLETRPFYRVAVNVCPHNPYVIGISCSCSAPSQAGLSSPSILPLAARHPHPHPLSFVVAQGEYLPPAAGGRESTASDDCSPLIRLRIEIKVKTDTAVILSVPSFPSRLRCVPRLEWCSFLYLDYANSTFMDLFLTWYHKMKTHISGGCKIRI